MGGAYELLVGDALAVMSTLPSGSFDAMLTDPPYGISFMGREWDRGVPSADVWREALRVLKPGAFALVACGTRTQHRMVAALEDAGFEVRDVIAWLYGSGFPKSHDVSKAIDRAAGAERERVAGPPTGGMASLNRGNAEHGYRPDAYYDGGNMMLSATPATPDAARWQGYGTALKPAMELWTLVRKPPEGTVAANALTHGTGALNIDGTRVNPGEAVPGGGGWASHRADNTDGWDRPYVGGVTAMPAHALGRWPANVIHDGSDEVLTGFPESDGSGPARVLKRGQRDDGWGMADVPGALRDAGSGSAARFFYTAKASRREREAGLDGFDVAQRKSNNLAVRVRRCRVCGSRSKQSGPDARWPNCPHDDWEWVSELPEGHKGGNARNPHPTVKPIALTRYLATLLLPPERDTPRRILTPFSGVGSEMIGALQAGWDEATGIEIDAEYTRIARARLEHHLEQPRLLGVA